MEMRKHYLRFTALAVMLGLIAACSSGRKALQRGEYDKAVLQAVNRLRNDTDNDKAIATLPRAYKLAVEMHRRNAARAENSNDPLKWERVIREYSSIDRLNSEIMRCPACMKHVLKLDEVQSEVVRLQNRAAESRYQMALAALQDKNNRSKAIEAIEHLKRAQDYVPNYKDSQQLMEEAQFYATLHVVIEPIPAPMAALQLNQDFFSNKVNEYVHRNLINPYVRFYTPNEANSLGLEYIDHRISMRFDQFSLGNIISNTDSKEMLRDSVLIDKDKKVYGTVKATFIKKEKALVGNGLLDFQIYDERLNKVVSQEKFPSSYRWGVVWATYQGDERALTEEQKALLNNRELPIPNPQYMFEEFATPLYDQVLHKLNTYYKSY